MLRNPVVKIGDVEVLNIGDPHLGKKWNTANSESKSILSQLQWHIFKQSVCHSEQPVKVIMGDIFDKPNVDEATLLRTYEILKETNGKVYILEGNHDSSKTSLEKTSFDVLEMLVKDLDNVIIIRGVINTYIGGVSVSFIGWEYKNTIAEQIEKYLSPDTEVLYTHVDFTSYGKNVENVLPFEKLPPSVKTVINGHEHLPLRSKEGNVNYIGTGSMMPFDRSQQHSSDNGTYADLFITIFKGDDLDPEEWKDKLVYYQTDEPMDLPEFEGSYGVILKRSINNDGSLDVLLEMDEISIPALLAKAAVITGLTDDVVSDLVAEFEGLEDE